MSPFPRLWQVLFRQSASEDKERGTRGEDGRERDKQTDSDRDRQTDGPTGKDISR